MIDKSVTNAKMMEIGDFSTDIINRLKRDQHMSLDSIERICYGLVRSVDDIIEFMPDKE